MRLSAFIRENLESILQEWEDFAASLSDPMVLLIGSSDVIAGVRRLHDAGIDLSVDDFGTDLLPFTQLKQFAVNTIKLDPSLVQDIATQASSKKMLEAITRAHQLGITVVADGVETSDQPRLAPGRALRPCARLFSWRTGGS